MDTITDFFNKAHITVHNKDAQKTPAEFLDCDTPAKTVEYFKWIRHHSQCGSMKLDVLTDVTEIKDELIKLSSLGIAHRSGNSEGWRSITLYGYSSIMTSSSDYYINQGLVTADTKLGWTDVAEFAPKTVAWIKQYSPITEYSRIRVMIVDPGGYIQPHIDHTAGQLLAANIHVAVVHPEGVEFALDNCGIIPWKEGDIRVVDIGRAHSVRNLSDQIRIHLIISPKEYEWEMAAMQTACSSYTKFQQDIL